MISIKTEKEHMIDETLRLLTERYPIGLYEFLFKYEPKMYRKLRELEDEISRDYSNKTIEDLKEVLREYWTLHMEAIREFENQDDLDLRVSEVKQQIQEELHAV